MAVLANLLGEGGGGREDGRGGEGEEEEEKTKEDVEDGIAEGGFHYSYKKKVPDEKEEENEGKFVNE